jgi:hypothetical protein
MPGELRSVLMSQWIALFYSDFSTIFGRRGVFQRHEPSRIKQEHAG